MRTFLKMGLIAAAVFFLMSGTAAGLEALGAEWTVPITRQDTLVDANGNVTLELSLLDVGTISSSIFHNPKAYERGVAMYTTGRYRVYDAVTNQTLAYYMVERPYLNPPITASYGFDLYISVNPAQYSGKIRVQYTDQQQIDVKNKNAVAFAYTNESYVQTQGTLYTPVGYYLKEINTGAYDSVRASSMSILTNGNGTSGTSGIFFYRPVAMSWSEASGFWAESGYIYTLYGRQNSTSWSNTSIAANTDSTFGVRAFAIWYDIGANNITRTEFRAAPYADGISTPSKYYNITAPTPPAYTHYDKLYIGNGEFYFNDFIGFVFGGSYTIQDGTIYNETIAPEQVIITAPSSAFVSDIITVSAAVYPTSEWAQEVTWSVGGAYELISSNATTAVLKCVGTHVAQNATITATAAEGVSASTSVAITIPELVVTFQRRLVDTPRQLLLGEQIITYFTDDYTVDNAYSRVMFNVSLADVPSSWYNLSADDSLFVSVRVDSRLLNNVSNPNVWRKMYTPVGTGISQVNLTVARNGVVLYNIPRAWSISVRTPSAVVRTPANNSTVLEQMAAGNNSFYFNWSSTPAYQVLVYEHALDPDFTNVITSDQYMDWTTPYTGTYNGSILNVVDSWVPGTHYFRLKALNGTVIGVRSVVVEAAHARGPISFEILDTQTGRPVNNSSVTLENATSKTYWFDTEETPGIIQIPADGLFDSYQASVFADGYASEYLTVAAGNNYTVYLVPEASSAHIRFSLIDNTGDFPWGSSHLLIKPQFGAVFDPLYFNAAGEAVKQLTIGQNYSLTIVNVSGATRDAGFIVPLGNQTIQLVIGDLLLQKTNGSWGNFSYNLQLVRRSATGEEGLTDYTAVLNWSRGEGYTGDAYMTITNTNTSAVVDSVNMTSQTGDRVFQIPYTSDLYQIMLRWYDNGTWYEDVRYITPQKALDALAISPTVRNIVCLCLLFIIALVFSQINAQIGAVIILATAAVMYAIGALIITPYVLFCVALIPVVALLGNRYLRGG